MQRFANTTSVDNADSSTPFLDHLRLRQLNSEEVVRLIPLNIYLALISVVGFIGNSIVCQVYRTNYKRSNSKYFIMCLSVIDLFSCCLVLPFEIVTVLRQYTFEDVFLCKFSRFFNTLPTVASGLMVLAIAVDRYRKVCRPLGWQITHRLAKWVCAGTILCGLVLSWPALLLYGKKTFYVPKYDLIATECSMDDSMKGTIYPFINNATFGFLFMVATTSLIVIYSIIGRTISRHAKTLIRHQSSVEMNAFRLEQSDCCKETSENQSVLEQTEANNERANTIPRRKTSDAPVRIGTMSVEQNSDVISDNTNVDGRTRKTSKSSNSIDQATCTAPNSPNRSLSSETNYRRKTNGKGMREKLKSFKCRLTSSGSSFDAGTGSSTVGDTIRKGNQSRQIRVRKTGMLMFLISLAYILSYLPHVLLMLLRAVKGEFVNSMSNEGRAVYKFFLRSYALNCVVNPFIYSACDVRFRNACRALFSGRSHRFKNRAMIR